MERQSLPDRQRHPDRQSQSRDGRRGRGGVNRFPDRASPSRAGRGGAGSQHRGLRQPLNQSSQSQIDLSSEQIVEAAEPESWVTLARGTNSSDETQQVRDNKTSGGSSSARSDGSAPSNQTAVNVVAFEAAPWARPPSQSSQPSSAANTVEYTTDMQIAQHFGRRGDVVIIKIQRKYLVKGSVTESGWICFKDAPVEVLN